MPARIDQDVYSTARLVNESLTRSVLRASDLPVRVRHDRVVIVCVDSLLASQRGPTKYRLTENEQNDMIAALREYIRRAHGVQLSNQQLRHMFERASHQ